MGVVLLWPVPFRLTAIVEAQRKVMGSWFPNSLGFVFVSHRGRGRGAPLPFDLRRRRPSSLPAFIPSYSGMKFGMFFVGEYLGLILISSMITVLFFRWLAWVRWLPPILWFLIKRCLPFICFFYSAAGVGFPGFVFDQLIDLGLGKRCFRWRSSICW